MEKSIYLMQSIPYTFLQPPKFLGDQFLGCNPVQNIVRISKNSVVDT